MAQMIKTNYTSDLSEKDIPEGEERVATLYDPELGRLVELDLLPSEADAFARTYARTLGKYLEKAHPVVTTEANGHRSSTRAMRRRSHSAREQSSKIRAWAKAEGIEVSERGRIPGHVIARYEASVR